MSDKFILKSTVCSQRFDGEYRDGDRNESDRCYGLVGFVFFTKMYTYVLPHIKKPHHI